MNTIVSLIIKLALLVASILIIYGLVRPVGIFGYCRITNGVGDVTIDKVLDPLPSKNLQESKVETCIDDKIQLTSIKWLDDGYTYIWSKIHPV